MKHCKKLAAIASALLVLGFTACSSDGDGGSGSNDSTQAGIPATSKPSGTTPKTPASTATATTGPTGTTGATGITTNGTPTTNRTPSPNGLVKPTYKTVYNVTADTYMAKIDEIIARLNANDPSQPKEFEFKFSGTKPITWEQFFNGNGNFGDSFYAKMKSIKKNLSDVRVGMDFRLAKVDDDFITRDPVFQQGPYKSIVLPKKISDNLTLYGFGYFNGCDYLEYIKFPDNLSSFNEQQSCINISSPAVGVSLKFEIPASVKTIGLKAFSNCKSLDTVFCNEGLTEIGVNVFGASSIKKVVLNNGLETIAEQAFCDCKSLESIELPSSLKSIKMNAFSCSGLKKIVIPENVTNLGEGIFNACQNLETVEIHTPEIGDNVLSNTNSIVIGEKVVKIGKNNFGDTALSSVVFKNPEGWKCDGVAVDAAILKDPADAATYLKTNKDKVFTRQ